MFNTNNTKTFEINSKKYTIHDYALKKASLFCLFFDDEIPKSNLFSFNFDISDEIINKVFQMMYKYDEYYITNKDKPDNISTLKFIINIVSYMQYIGLNKKLLNKFIYNFMDDDNIDSHKFIKDLKNEQYNDHISLIFDFFPYFKVVDTKKKLSDKIIMYKKMVNKIKAYQHPDDLKLTIFKRLLINILSTDDYDLLLVVKGDQIHNYNRSKFRHINYTKKTAKLKSIKRIYKKMLDVDITHTITFEEITIKSLIINNKDIPLYKTKISTCNGYGGNLEWTICLHIARVLLGIDTI